MRNKTKGVIAGVAGLALLSGGVTYSLWSDSATVPGGTITNGNLDVAAIGALAWVDVSPDRADAGHAITDLATWRMVPGDIIEGTQGIGVALEGDNLVATLEVSSATDPATFPTGISVTYDVLQGATARSRRTSRSARPPRCASRPAGPGRRRVRRLNAPPTVVIDDIVVPDDAEPDRGPQGDLRRRDGRPGVCPGRHRAGRRRGLARPGPDRGRLRRRPVS